MTRRGRRWLGGVVLAALVVPLLVDWLWTTDEDRILATLKRIESALVQRNADALLAECEADVAVDTPAPGLRPGAAFAESVRAFVKRVDELKIDREKTEISLEGGLAHVHCSGLGLARAQGFGGAWRFDVEADFERDENRRFLLARVRRIRVEPGLQ